MTDKNRTTSIEQWTSVQAYTLAVICLLRESQGMVHTRIPDSGSSGGSSCY